MCLCNVISILPGLICSSAPRVLLPSRMYHAEKLPETNLVFIISDAKVTCSSCKSKKLIQDEQQCILSANTETPE